MQNTEVLGAMFLALIVSYSAGDADIIQLYNLLLNYNCYMCHKYIHKFLLFLPNINLLM